MTTTIVASDLGLPTLLMLMDSQVDVTAPKAVEVLVSKDKTVAWININGVCVLRACRIPAGGLTIKEA